MATGPFVSDYWDTLSLQPMFDELERRSRMFAAEGGRYGGKINRMYAALHTGPPVDDDNAPTSTGHYARSSGPGAPYWPSQLAREIDCPAPAAKEHAPMQVAFFAEDGKEPIRDPSYRRLLVEFERRGDFMVNAKAITFPAATCSWGVIDEARIFDEEGDELFSCPVSHPPHISAGCTIRFHVGELRVPNQEWFWQLGEDPVTESKLTVSDNFPDYVPLSRTVGSKDITFPAINNPQDRFFFRETETGFTIFDPGLVPTEPKGEPQPVVPPAKGFYSAFRERYGSFIDSAPLAPAKPEPREYIFPVRVGIEHGQHDMNVCSTDGRVCAYCTPGERLVHQMLLNDDMSGLRKHMADHAASYRQFMITGTEPEQPGATPQAAPGTPQPSPAKEPEPEEDLAAIRAHNHKIMFGE